MLCSSIVSLGNASATDSTQNVQGNIVSSSVSSQVVRNVFLNEQNNSNVSLYPVYLEKFVGSEIYIKIEGDLRRQFGVETFFSSVLYLLRGGTRLNSGVLKVFRMAVEFVKF